MLGAEKHVPSTPGLVGETDGEKKKENRNDKCNKVQKLP